MAWTCSACSGANPEGTRFCGLCGAQRAGSAAAASREERRLVTALFADISGFSELTNRLDAEQLLEIIDPAVAALSDVVGRYEGVIEKFAGDALMALFGAPVAHEDDASRALHVALDMHADLARLVTRLPEAAAGLRLHIGVNSGHGIGRTIGSSVRHDYGVLGDVVVVAQRLEAAAPTGETYVGETTYELTRKDFELEPVGEIRLKGKDVPVRAWRLIGPRRRHVLGAGAAARRLAGRDAELAALAGFCARLDSGAGGAAFVLGEAGVGKTALCEALRGRAATAGWDWLEARCLSYGAELAYWPIADVFRRMLALPETRGGEAVSALEAALDALGLAETVPFLGALCGIDGAGAAGLTPETFHTRLQESVIAVLRARATARPAVVHLDDLQWADGATAALLRSVLGATADLPLVLVASSRASGSALVDELTAALPSASLRLDLGPLGVDAVADVAHGILGGPPDAALAAWLLEHTAGNPFFVEEVTRSLAERRALDLHDGTWRRGRRVGGDDRVPLTVEGVVAARVDALGVAERTALEVLAVVGRRAHLALAQTVDGGVEAALPALRAAGLIDAPGEDLGHAVFHHPLTQQVVESRLVRRRRAQLHRAVGEAAEALFGADDATVELLARHFSLGGQPAKAFEYSLRAADRAERLFANEAAVRHLREALDLERAATGDQAGRAELLLRCGRLEAVRGEYRRALIAFDEALALGGGARAAVGKAHALRTLGEYGLALDVVREARAAQPDLTPEETALLAGVEGWVAALMGDNRRAAVILRGGAAAAAARDPGLEADLLVSLARVEQQLLAYDAAAEHAETALRLAEAGEDLPRQATILRVLGGIQQHIAERDGLPNPGVRTLERALVMARRVGNAEEEAAALVNLAYSAGGVGEFEEAIRFDREAAAAFERVGLKAGIACAYCNLSDHLSGAGRFSEALEAAEQALPIAREIGNAFWTTGALHGIAAARTALGDLDGAERAARESAELAVAHGLSARAASAMERAAEVRRRLGDDAGAAELEARAEALARH